MIISYGRVNERNINYLSTVLWYLAVCHHCSIFEIEIYSTTRAVKEAGEVNKNEKSIGRWDNKFNLFFTFPSTLQWLPLSSFFKDFFMSIALVKLCSDSSLLETKQRNLQCRYTVK